MSHLDVIAFQTRKACIISRPNPKRIKNVEFHFGTTIFVYSVDSCLSSVVHQRKNITLDDDFVDLVREAK
jgi:hypothetical protein